MLEIEKQFSLTSRYKNFVIFQIILFTILIITIPFAVAMLIYLVRARVTIYNDSFEISGFRTRNFFWEEIENVSREKKNFRVGLQGYIAKFIYEYVTNDKPYLKIKTKSENKPKGLDLNQYENFNEILEIIGQKSQATISI